MPIPTPSDEELRAATKRVDAAERELAEAREALLRLQHRKIARIPGL